MLLLNGCSYGLSWGTELNLFSQSLGFDKAVNLSKTGSSNDRIIRTTFEYLEKNLVEFIVLSLTFWDRQEAPWKSYEDYESVWSRYSSIGISNFNDIVEKSEIDIYNKYIKERYLYDISTAYIEKLLLDLIFFTAWLDLYHYKYLIYVAPGFDKDEIPVYANSKFNILKKNNRLIDLENFSSNEYLGNNGGTSLDKVDFKMKHYDQKSHRILGNFLKEYIHNNNLL
jgi:hypothetical protein